MKISYILLTLASFIVFPVHAEGNISAKQSEVLKQLLATYAEKAKEEVKSEKGRGAVSDKAFSAEVGREFYLKRRTWQSKDFTCSGCHTEDPTKVGKHIETKSPIPPLAPAANPGRFVDARKVERNFTEHCLDLHERDCRAFEKGNFLTYLMSLK
jgi:hypothetical protein